MKKKTKAPSLAAIHKEALAKIAGMKEFAAFEQLAKIQENNIIIGSFKVNSSDPDIVRKKAWMEGRLFELRAIMKTFSDVRKLKEDE